MIDSSAASFVYNEEVYRITDRPTIVLTVPWDEVPPEEKDQLAKITDALRDKIHPSLSLDGFRIVEEPNLDLSQWTHRPAYLIYFGPAIKGVNYYEVIEAGSTRMIMAESLSELLKNVDAKTKLWQGLKLLFSGGK
jgi:hypothetical protein